MFWEGGSPRNGGHAVKGEYNNFENPSNKYSYNSNEPNSSGEEDCVAMRCGHQQNMGSTDGSWNDENCYHGKDFFVVEFDG